MTLDNNLFVNLLQSFSDYSAFTFLSLTLLAFLAGFVDAVVGGGGLIQLPALLISFPEAPVATLFGTNKIAAFSGTSIAAYKYSRQVKFDYRILLPASLCSAAASFAGAKIVSLINVNILKPVILVLLIIIVVYTIIKKDLGETSLKELSVTRQAIFASILGIIIGFYDGFLGPGTGSFLVLGFVVILGFEFLKASAYSKFINCITNISALLVFIRQGNFLLLIALFMAVANIIGSILGTRLAVARGNKFIRVFFIVVVVLMISRYAYDIFLS